MEATKNVYPADKSVQPTIGRYFNTGPMGDRTNVPKIEPNIDRRPVPSFADNEPIVIDDSRNDTDENDEPDPSNKSQGAGLWGQMKNEHEVKQEGNSERFGNGTSLDEDMEIVSGAGMTMNMSVNIADPDGAGMFNSTMGPNTGL